VHLMVAGTVIEAEVRSGPRGSRSPGCVGDKEIKFEVGLSQGIGWRGLFGSLCWLKGFRVGWVRGNDGYGVRQKLEAQMICNWDHIV